MLTIVFLCIKHLYVLSQLSYIYEFPLNYYDFHSISLASWITLIHYQILDLLCSTENFKFNYENIKKFSSDPNFELVKSLFIFISSPLIQRANVLRFNRNFIIGNESNWIGRNLMNMQIFRSPLLPWWESWKSPSLV